MSYLEVYFYVMKITSSKVYFSSKKGVSINLSNNFFLKFSVIPNRFFRITATNMLKFINILLKGLNFLKKKRYFRKFLETK